MSLLIMLHRQHYLKNRINELDYKLMQRKKDLINLSTYSASVADGSVTFDELTNCPSNLFNRMTGFMFNSHNAAMMGAQQNFQQMTAAGALTQQGADAQQQAAYSQMVMQNLYKQQREQAANYEERILNEQNKRIDQECLQIENELKQLQAEYDGVKQAADKAAQSEAPAYVA